MYLVPKKFEIVIKYNSYVISWKDYQRNWVFEKNPAKGGFEGFLKQIINLG